MTDVAIQQKALPVDARLREIQVAHNIVTQDVTTPTPRVSPLTVSSTALEIKIPNTDASYGLVLHLIPTGAVLRVGDNSTLDGTPNEGYFTIADGGSRAIPVSNLTSIWVVRDAAVDVTLSFYFEVLKK